MKPRVYNPLVVDYLVGLDDSEPADVVDIEDVPRNVRDAFEEAMQDRREWTGDLSE